LQAQGLTQKVEHDEKARKWRDAQENAGNQRQYRQQNDDGPRNRFTLHSLNLQEAIVGCRLGGNSVVDDLRLNG
jgi:hypothetical protein